MKGKIAEMNLLTLFLVLVMCVSSISCQEEGSGESAGGHDQPAPDQQPPTPDNKPAEGEAGADPKKKAGEQGYTQGFNQGVKPYSYGYNTGIKPYSYNFYQPLGGKPQVVEQGGPDAEKKGEAGATANKSAQPSPPPLPAIDFPADFSAFGLSPADLAIPPPPAQQGQAAGQLSGQQRPPIPFNFPPPAQPARPAEPGAPGQTPPPFNYAEYGIPTDIGTATGSAVGSPFGILDGGVPRRPQQRVMEGDDFGIFGGNGNSNGNNGLVIPVLEDGNNQNNQQNLGIPLFGGGGGGQSPGNDFNFANNDLGNDFNVAASDFEPFNFQNFVPAEFAQTVGPAGSTRPSVASAAVPAGSVAKNAAPIAQQHLTPRDQPGVVYDHPVAAQAQQGNASTQRTRPSAMQRKQMYKASLAPEVVKRSARSLQEQPHEKPLKDDPHSAWNILNMDPAYTNPNQGVYSYYPAYRMPS